MNNWPLSYENGCSSLLLKELLLELVSPWGEGRWEEGVVDTEDDECDDVGDDVIATPPN